MKKLLAMAVVAVGMVVGAGSASASSYPPGAPIITTPISVGAGESFTAVVSGLAAGDTVTLTFLGQTYTKTPSASAGALPTGNASVTFNLKAPTTVGTVPITASTASGWAFKTSINVVAVNPPKVPAGKTPAGKLPATGSNLVMPGVGFGLAAVAGGLGLLFVSKRRRTASV